MINRPGRTKQSRGVGALLITTAVLGLAGSPAVRGADTPLTVDFLLRMSAPELDSVYRQGMPIAIPAQRVRGTALLAPGSWRNRPMSIGTRFIWQGKVFGPADSEAVNRFFGMRMVRAEVLQDASWLDGGPSLVLDYSRTSRIYARYRDEIRQVGPGLFLGLMYDRSTPRPDLRMYFALETQP